MVRTIDVAALLARLGALPRRITSDSREVTSESAFAAYPGSARDGRAFIADAVSRSAAGVLFEPDGFKWDAALTARHLAVPELKQKLGPIADFIYGSPSKRLWMIGVTGTNGKTSCTQWLGQALNQLGRRTALIGTLGSGFPGSQQPMPNTTPDAALLHETLAGFEAEGASAVAMEVSSIGLEHGRVNGTRFDVALFTNLSRDHLDFHGTMAAYGAAKARLLSWPTLSAAVVNADDDFGKGLVEKLRGLPFRTLTYGLAGADVTISSLVTSASGMRLQVMTPFGSGELRAPLVGSFNVMNLLGTLGVLLASDVALNDALGAMSQLAAPPGRVEKHGGGDRPLVVIDYAHTPDALENVLQALRPAVRNGGSMVCVFGCGGDRDPGKRPEMGRIAATLADRVVVTSDNPRSEDPTTIAMAIAQGVRAAGNRHWMLEVDRAKAIRGAIEAARAGDVVVVAGKGHEAYQERNGERRPFSDAAEAASALAAWSAR